MLSQSFIDEMRKQLLKKKQQLADDLAGLSAHTEMGDDEDENAEEVGVDEASRDVMAVMRSDMDKIDKALIKIGQGTYGTDDEGKPIGEARLRAMPWADKAL